MFGPPTQNGVVVPSLEQAIAYWTQSIGAGPFFVFDTVPHEAFFIGEKAAPPPEMRIALGNWGDLQIELIEPRGDSAATWHEFLRLGGRGLHHTSGWTRNYDEVVAGALARGLRCEVRGKLRNGVRYAYFRIDDQALIEISEVTDEVAAGYAYIREVAIDWDGADPVRRLG